MYCTPVQSVARKMNVTLIMLTISVISVTVTDVFEEYIKQKLLEAK